MRDSPAQLYAGAAKSGITVNPITSRDNVRVRRWRALARDVRARRKEKRALIEGEHLVTACLDAGGKLEELLLGEGSAIRFEAIVRRHGRSPVLLDDAVFRSIADTETPAGIAAEIALPAPAADLRHAPTCVFMDGIQDAGNVGTILRSAAAFGVGCAVLGKGCADAWSPKVLRAGMGAQFGLAIEEGADLAEAMARFGGRVACTVAGGGVDIARIDLSGRIGWLFGSEGQGVSEPLASQAALRVTIPMPGTAESLNVAAAAAICFYEFSRRAARS
jgi:TrmH family RNA methyltransferase